MWYRVVRAATREQEASTGPGRAEDEGQAGGILPGPPQECPGCGEPGPVAVFDGSRTNFLCRRCGSCWRMGMGYIWLVDGGPPRP